MSKQHTEQDFKNALNLGQQICYTPKGTLYSIICVGKTKHESTNQWYTSVTYSDGKEFYTRLIRDMGKFTICTEKSEAFNEQPRFYTAVFAIHDNAAFAGIQGMLGRMMENYCHSTPPTYGIVAGSHENEMLRLEIIEALAEDPDAEMFEIQQTLDRTNLSHNDLTELTEEH